MAWCRVQCNIDFTACVRCLKQEAAGYASPAEPRIGLTSLHQCFSSSAANAAPCSERGSQAAGSGAKPQQLQQPGSEPAQAAGDAGQQQNGNGAEQEPPTLEGLQAELQAQRATSEEQEAQVGGVGC